MVVGSRRYHPGTAGGQLDKLPGTVLSSIMPVCSIGPPVSLPSLLRQAVSRPRASPVEKGMPLSRLSRERIS